MRIEALKSGADDAHSASFGAVVDGDVLRLPEPVLTQLSAANLRYAEELLAFVYAFPSITANLLGMSAGEVDTARAELVNTLREHVPQSLIDTVLSTEPLPRFATGAIMPTRGVNLVASAVEKIA